MNLKISAVNVKLCENNKKIIIDAIIFREKKIVKNYYSLHFAISLNNFHRSLNCFNLFKTQHYYSDRDNSSINIH